MSETPSEQAPIPGGDADIPMDVLGDAPVEELDAAHQFCENREDPSSWDDPAITEAWEEPSVIEPTVGSFDPAVDR